MSNYKPILAENSHFVGNRLAKVLKVNGVWTQIIILNSAWKDLYHFIIEELDGMTAVKSEHRVIDKQELIQEINGDYLLVEQIINDSLNININEASYTIQELYWIGNKVRSEMLPQIRKKEFNKLKKIDAKTQTIIQNLRDNKTNTAICIEFASFLTGHDKETITQMFNDWRK